MFEWLLAETVRCYGYPVVLSKGWMGVSASGEFGGMWVCMCNRSRTEERRAWRALLGQLRAQPTLPAWKPWVRAVFKAP